MTSDESDVTGRKGFPSGPSDEEAASEATPLLRSEASSHTLRDGSPGLSSSSSSIRSHSLSRTRSSGQDSTVPNQHVGALRGLIIILSTWIFIFLQASNMSGMTMTQSAIAEELHVYSADAMWFTSAYLLSTSSVSPVAGRLATIFSPRGLVVPIATFFALGGIVTATAQSFGALILGRVLTGLGGAGTMTLSVILVLELTSKRRRGLFIGLVNAGFTIGLSFGAVVFGAALPVTGWRWLFGIQTPFAVLAGFGVFLSIPKTLVAGKESQEKSMRDKMLGIDYGGAFLLSMAIVLFLYGLIGEIKWQPLVISLVALAVFVFYEYHAASDPIIPLKVLSSRGVLMTCLAQLGFMSARWTLLFYAPVFLLAVRGASSAASGAILIPTNLGFGSGGLIIGWLHIRRGGSFWLPALVGLAFFGVTLFSLSLVGYPESPFWAFVLVVFLNGLATGAGLNYTLAHLLHLSHADTQYITTSLLGTFRGFGGSFGTAIGGGVFYRTLRGLLEEGFRRLDGTDVLSPAREALVGNLTGIPALVYKDGLLNAEEREVAVQGYAGAARGTWQAAAALSILVILVQAATGWEAPKDHTQEGEEDRTGARAALLENEGVGEA